MFHKYPEIENSYQQGFIDKIKEAGYENISYLITEKIHGSNSQVRYDMKEKTFSFGTRNNPLPDTDSHYHLRECIEPLKYKITLIAEALSSDLAAIGQTLTAVTLYGEICGGSYPHPDVPKDKNAIKVQKGVFYSPSNQWYAFDIGYEIAHCERMFFLSGSKFTIFCQVAKIPTVPLLHSAPSLEEALEYPNNKTSYISEQNNLPALESNIMEGVVIRPMYQDIWFGHTRLVLKNKNDTFKEKWKTKKAEPPEELSDKTKQAIQEIAQYIHPNRVHNVISHIGEVTEKDIGKVIMLTSKDVLEDYNKEHDTLSCLEKKEEKAVNKYMNGEVAKLVRDIIIYKKQ